MIWIQEKVVVRDRMCSMLTFVNSKMAKEVAGSVGAKIDSKPVIPPNAADPKKILFQTIFLWMQLKNSM